MSYTIEIHYRTGNSFESHDETETIGCIWEDKEQARLALSYIKEHYEFYKEANAWRSGKTEKEMQKAVKNKPWVIELAYWEHGLLVPVGDSTQRISAFWCGYFETLHGAKIIPIGDDEDSFEF
jgi:hypothetical protein